MNKFVSKLEDLDYFLFVRAYSGLYRPLEIAAMRIHLPPKLRLLVDAFSLRQEVEADELASIITDSIFERLLEARILISSTEDLNKVRGNCVLMEVCGHSYFFEPSPDPIAYFAEDSLALERYMQKTRCSSALDLCAGPGLQSLSLAQHSERVTAVEIDETTYKILLINIAMSVNRNKINSVNTSVANFITSSSAQFDQIVCNPPLLPLPDDLAYPFAGHGGEDGLRVTREILANLIRISATNGIVEILGASLYNKSGLATLDFLKGISEKNGFPLTFLELSRYPWGSNSLFFQNLLATAVYQMPGGERVIALKLREFMEHHNADGVFVFFTKFARDSGFNNSSNRINFSTISQTGWFI